MSRVGNPTRRIGNPTRRIGWPLALLILGALPCGAQATAEDVTAGVARLKVEVTPAEITVGDRVEAKLTLVWMGQEPTAEPRFPAWQETWGSAEVLEVGEVDAFADQSARRIYRQTLVLTAFETGEVRLPKVTVALPLEAETLEVTHDDQASFEVKSVLPEDDEEGEETELEVRGAAPPVDLAAGQRFLWTAGALCGLCLLIAWKLARRLEVGGGEPKPTLLGPLDELIHGLWQLDPRAVEPAHTGLSLVLRNFLARSLAFPALESTTSEIQRRLRETPVAPAVAHQAVRLLRDADQVKFAGRSVDESITSGRLAETRELGRQIEHQLRPSEPAGEAAG